MPGCPAIILSPNDVPRDPESDLWVFGYGSLMWDPGFAFTERRRATLEGFHRSFCIASHRHRGTPQRPGLVFGLDRGGSCTGIAFRVAADACPSVLEYLWVREMVTDAYHPRLLPVRLDAEVPDPPERDGAKTAGQAPAGSVKALCFVVNPEHEQYLGRLPVQRAAEMIRTARGGRGHNLEYLLNTADHLRQLGIIDAELEALRRAVAEADTDLDRPGDGDGAPRSDPAS